MTQLGGQGAVARRDCKTKEHGGHTRGEHGWTWLFGVVTNRQGVPLAGLGRSELEGKRAQLSSVLECKLQEACIANAQVSKRLHCNHMYLAHVLRVGAGNSGQTCMHTSRTKDAGAKTQATGLTRPAGLLGRGVNDVDIIVHRRARYVGLLFDLCIGILVQQRQGEWMRRSSSRQSMFHAASRPALHFTGQAAQHCTATMIVIIIR